jgi:ElaB/YqjD/DUF883 family membrane-anchored ribosome-binding protein
MSAADEPTGERDIETTRVSQAQPDPEELRREIDETRQELGDTAEALSHKADVKAQAKDKIDERKQAASAKAEELKQKAEELKQKASQATPEDVKSAASGAATTARDRPEIPAIAAALFFGLLLGWLIGRR